MPIGAGFSDFSQLKQRLRDSYANKGKNLPDERLNAVTATVASNINPGWRSEAAKKAAMTRRVRGER